MSNSGGEDKTLLQSRTVASREAEMTSFGSGNVTARTYKIAVSTFVWIIEGRVHTSSSWPEREAESLKSAMLGMLMCSFGDQGRNDGLIIRRFNLLKELFGVVWILDRRDKQEVAPHVCTLAPSKLSPCGGCACL